MTTVDVQGPPKESKPELPDYVTDPNAVLKDKGAKWRYGLPPDYSKTRKVYHESKLNFHAARHPAGGMECISVAISLRYTLLASRLQSQSTSYFGPRVALVRLKILIMQRIDRILHLSRTFFPRFPLCLSRI